MPPAMAAVAARIMDRAFGFLWNYHDSKETYKARELNLPILNALWQAFKLIYWRLDLLSANNFFLPLPLKQDGRERLGQLSYMQQLTVPPIKLAGRVGAQPVQRKPRRHVHLSQYALLVEQSSQL